MGPRASLSGILIVGALVLLVAITVGNSMGNRVLGQIPERMPALATTPVPSPTAAASDDSISQALWKRRQVLSVATDPAFPDPRVTPEPPAPATPRPTPRLTPSPSPSPVDDRPNVNYTSPPLPIPLDTGPEQTPAAEQETATPSPRASATNGRAGARAGLVPPPAETQPTLVP